ncbi:hypothetical protein CTI12_AA199850 [Artemisia annua]|uniref:Uncharacterized protein n=1 Tax=Artemisia annua TaxID=35608 RepID=A0A2U1P2Z7_ARTAN|nr:hypothetical protein CTI12_AA199850 [Artemisia annua]
MRRQSKITESSKPFKKYISNLKHDDPTKGGVLYQPNHRLTQSRLPQYSWYHCFEPTKTQPLATHDLVTTSEYNTPLCLSTNDDKSGHKKKRNGGHYFIEDCKGKKLKGIAEVAERYEKNEKTYLHSVCQSMVNPPCHSNMYATGDGKHFTGIHVLGSTNTVCINGLANGYDLNSAHQYSTSNTTSEFRNFAHTCGEFVSHDVQQCIALSDFPNSSCNSVSYQDSNQLNGASPNLHQPQFIQSYGTSGMNNDPQTSYGHSQMPIEDTSRTCTNSGRKRQRKQNAQQSIQKTVYPRKRSKHDGDINCLLCEAFWLVPWCNVFNFKLRFNLLA